MRKIIFAMALMTLVIGCQTKPGSSGATAEGSLVIATVNGVDITEADLESRSNQIRQAKVDLYNARKQAADMMIAELLLQQAAEKAGQTPEAYLQQQINLPTSIPEEQVTQFYEQRKERFQGKPLEEVRDIIVGFLTQQAGRQAQGQVLAELRKDAKVDWNIEAPRVEVEAGDFPSRGPQDASVVIVEFSDYQCPFCGRARDTVNQILKEYDGKVRYVFRDFPLSFHKDAQKAHEAAHCASEQGKYWDYNDKLFKSQRELQVKDLKQYAKDLGLDADKFNECVDSGRYAQMVQQSVAYGQTVGVSGTPAFFINGRMISGARPFEAFQEVIDDELSQAN